MVQSAQLRLIPPASPLSGDARDPEDPSVMVNNGQQQPLLRRDETGDPTMRVTCHSRVSGRDCGTPEPVRHGRS
jgi:hypothetical protein